MIHDPNTRSDSDTPNGSAHYVLAQYVAEPMRQEARNVGVIVRKNGVVSTRFVGDKFPAKVLENDGNDWDSAKLRFLNRPNVYKLWVDSWRRKIVRESVDVAMLSGNDQFHLIRGGEVESTGTDSVEQICDFLFDALVSSKGIGAAFDVVEETDSSPVLENEVVQVFRDLGILTGKGRKANNPIFHRYELVGSSGSHRVSLFQKKDKEYWAMEPIDFTIQNSELAIRRAALIRCEFEDLADGFKKRDANLNPVALVRSNAKKDERESWGIKLLEKSCEIVDWSSEKQRKKFLLEREQIAFGMAI